MAYLVGAGLYTVDDVGVLVESGHDFLTSSETIKHVQIICPRGHTCDNFALRKIYLVLINLPEGSFAAIRVDGGLDGEFVFFSLGESPLLLEFSGLFEVSLQIWRHAANAGNLWMEV